MLAEHVDEKGVSLVPAVVAYGLAE